MSRVFILLMDSFGIGASADAVRYGDVGANTLGHIAQHCAEGKANQVGLRSGPLTLPHLTRLGLGWAALASSGERVAGFDYDVQAQAIYGFAAEQSLGKDTPSGHWEIAGVPVLFEWGYFGHDYPSFPNALVTALIEQGQLPGILGNKHASGTAIINELGDEHVKSGKPILYTSGDSVFQIAAHEQSFGLDRLYQLCDIARSLVDEYHIGRVIARPFLGDTGHYYRTGNRRDLATPPPELTLLDYLVAAGREVISIGKVADIFAHRGITQKIKAHGNEAIFAALQQTQQQAPAGSLVFANFVDFDMDFGHRRDIPGYAAALERFDQALPHFEAAMQAGDIAIIAADHGCDPTFPGSDHTREHIPVLVFGPGVSAKFIGKRDSFADIGQSIATYLAIDPLPHGISFL